MISSDRWWHRGDHPIWAIARDVVMISVALVGLQLLTASSYDAGEAGAAGGTGIVVLLLRLLELRRKG